MITPVRAVLIGGSATVALALTLVLWGLSPPNDAPVPEQTVAEEPAQVEAAPPPVVQAPAPKPKKTWFRPRVKHVEAPVKVRAKVRVQKRERVVRHWRNVKRTCRAGYYDNGHGCTENWF